MKIPYAIADFYALRTEGYLYVDRTDRIALLEELGKNPLFLRPRRFGKSLWVRTLACYYDLRYASEHERLFGDLAVGKDPTPLAHRYFVLDWDFSDLDLDPPPLGRDISSLSRAQRIGDEIHGYVNSSLETFLLRYEEHLPATVELEADAFRNLARLLAVIERTAYGLYLLIDEYDNFANEVMTSDPDAYHDLVHTDGPFKRLFKWVKRAMAGQGLERLFITGVSPVVMSDVTSGMNVAENVYLYGELNDLCGFTDDEVRGLLAELHAEKAATGEPSWDAEAARDILRDWYNGYRFATGSEAAVYNPTLVLYFLKHLQRTGTYPRQMLDANLAADEGKLDYLAQVTAGQDAVIDLIRKGRPLASSWTASLCVPCSSARPRTRAS